jgi:flagellar motor switch protein FliG
MPDLGPSAREQQLDVPIAAAIRAESSGLGCQRAAAVLLGVGAEAAGTIFKMFGETELRRVALGAKDLRGAPSARVAEALESFLEAMETVGGDAAAGDDMLREVATKALGDDMARRAFDGVTPPPPPDEVLGEVSQADPEALAMVLGREQPQTIALVLSSLEPSRAAGVMDRLPEKSRPEVLRRMAAIESVAPRSSAKSARPSPPSSSRWSPAACAEWTAQATALGSCAASTRNSRAW